MKRTMYEAARHTPKRKAVGSNPAEDAKNSAGKPSKIKGFRRFSFLRRNSKNEKITNFHQQILRLLMEFRTNVVRLSGGQLANKN